MFHHILLLEPPLNNLQASAISLEISYLPIYCPPWFLVSSGPINFFFTRLVSHFIAGRDFNSKHFRWGSRLINPHRRSLLNWIQNNRLTVLSLPSPTYWSASVCRLPEILDIFVWSRVNSLNINTVNIDNLSLDHSPVSLLVNSLLYLFLLLHLYEIMKWPQFQELVKNNINLSLPLETPNETEEAVEHVYTVIQETVWSTCCPKCQTKNIDPNYPQEIQTFILEKWTAHRHLWQQICHTVDRWNINRLPNSKRKCNYVTKYEQFDDYISNLNASEDVQTATKWLVAEKAEQFGEYLSSLSLPVSLRCSWQWLCE